jgi:hypothetical protein
LRPVWHAPSKEFSGAPHPVKQGRYRRKKELRT